MVFRRQPSPRRSRRPDQGPLGGNGARSEQRAPPTSRPHHEASSRRARRAVITSAPAPSREAHLRVSRPGLDPALIQVLAMRLVPTLAAQRSAVRGRASQSARNRNKLAPVSATASGTPLARQEQRQRRESISDDTAARVPQEDRGRLPVEDQEARAAGASAPASGEPAPGASARSESASAAAVTSPCRPARPSMPSMKL